MTLRDITNILSEIIHREIDLLCYETLEKEKCPHIVKNVVKFRESKRGPDM